jgi:hypothetical protein
MVRDDDGLGSGRRAVGVERTKGPIHTSLGQRPRCTSPQFQRAEGPTYGLVGRDESGFQPSTLGRFLPWGFAPGWYETGLRP